MKSKSQTDIQYFTTSFRSQRGEVSHPDMESALKAAAIHSVELGGKYASVRVVAKSASAAEKFGGSEALRNFKGPDDILAIFRVLVTEPDYS